jgi:nucleoside-diphosphate-sugar epimerase
MRILVTGASGFLGQHCVRASAESGHHVIALNRTGIAPAGSTESLSADLLSADEVAKAVKMARADVLIHFAWHSDPRDRWHTLANLDWLKASIDLARCFAAQGGKRFLLVGSCAEYDWSSGLLSETTTPLRPATLYGASKAAAGMTLSAAAGALGLSFAWPRIFFCYGPGEPPGRLVSDLLAGLSRGDPVKCTDGEQQRDFMHAADIGAAIAAVAISSLEGPINIGSGQAVPVRDVIDLVAGALGKRPLVKLGAIARPADDPPRLVAEIGRLQSLGFRPRFDLGSGIRDTVANWRALNP